MIHLKNKAEIEGIRHSCRLLAKLFDVLEAEVRPGVSTTTLDARAKEYIYDNGADPAFLGYGGFPNTVCTSTNSEVIHGIPRDSPLCDGDIVSIDCGLVLQGFYSDCAHTFPVGSVDSEVEKLLKVTEESLYKGIEAAAVGNRIKDISTAIYQHVRPKNYGVVREYTGHGLGVELHEEPNVPNYPAAGPNPRIKAGLVLAIEPMINLGGAEVYVHADEWTVKTKDGSVSAHFEHTIVVHEDRTEILTRRV